MERILLFLLLSSSRQGDVSRVLTSFNDYISSVEIDVNYTEEKILLAKKIAPLMPAEYIRPMSQSISVAEKFLGIMEFRDYMTTSSISSQVNPVPIKDNRERIRKIISVIQEEGHTSNKGNLGPMLDFIVNMDKYKKMFEIFNSFVGNQNLSKDTDKIIKAMGPMMKAGASSSEGEPLDIEKIMAMMKLLNKSKEKTDQKERKNPSKDEEVLVEVDFKKDIGLDEEKERPKRE